MPCHDQVRFLDPVSRAGARGGRFGLGFWVRSQRLASFISYELEADEGLVLLMSPEFLDHGESRSPEIIRDEQGGRG